MGACSFFMLKSRPTFKLLSTTVFALELQCAGALEQQGRKSDGVSPCLSPPCGVFAASLPVAPFGCQPKIISQGLQGAGSAGWSRKKKKKLQEEGGEGFRGRRVKTIESWWGSEKEEDASPLERDLCFIKLGLFSFSCHPTHLQLSKFLIIQLPAQHLRSWHVPANGRAVVRLEENTRTNLNDTSINQHHQASGVSMKLLAARNGKILIIKVKLGHRRFLIKASAAILTVFQQLHVQKMAESQNRFDSTLLTYRFTKSTFTQAFTNLLNIYAVIYNKMFI